MTVAGTTSDTLSGVTSLTASLDGGKPFAVTADASGKFSFPTSLKLDGTADGKHTLVLVSTDVAGNATTKSVTFTLKAAPPAIPTFGLAIADQESNAPLSTTSSAPTLTGQTDPNISVKLVQTGATARTTNTGAFQFPGVSLALGDNVLTVVATDAAGNTSSYQLTVHRDASLAGTNPVIFWDQVTLQAIVNDASDPEHASRGLAMVSAAVYDTVNSIDGTPSYYVSLKAPADSLPAAAVASAAYTVLSYLYPAQQSYLNSVLITAAGDPPLGARADRRHGGGPVDRQRDHRDADERRVDQLRRL